MSGENEKKDEKQEPVEFGDKVLDKIRKKSPDTIGETDEGTCIVGCFGNLVCVRKKKHTRPF